MVIYDSFFYNNNFFNHINMVVFFLEICTNDFAKHNFMGYNFFNMAHTFHFFKEATNFLFNLSKVANLLNKHSNSVVSFFSDSDAFSFEMSNPDEEVFDSFS